MAVYFTENRISWVYVQSLGYVEPILMVAVALALGEQIRAEQWMTYLPIWMAVGLLIFDGGLHLWRSRGFKK